MRPRSSAKNACVLSPPSTVLLFRNPEIPRKLIRPNVPSGAAPGVLSTKFDQRRALTGRFSIDVWLMLVERSADSRLMTGVSRDDATDSVCPATPMRDVQVRHAPDFDDDAASRERGESAEA